MANSRPSNSTQGTFLEPHGWSNREARIHVRAVMDTRLSSTDVRIFAYLSARLFSAEGVPFPLSHREVGRALGLKQDTVQGRMKRLVALGYVRQFPPLKNGDANRYALTDRKGGDGGAVAPSWEELRSRWQGSDGGSSGGRASTPPDENPEGPHSVTPRTEIRRGPDRNPEGVPMEIQGDPDRNPEIMDPENGSTTSGGGTSRASAPEPPAIASHHPDRVTGSVLPSPSDGGSEYRRRLTKLWVWWSKRFEQHRGTIATNRNESDLREILRVLTSTAERNDEDLGELVAWTLDQYWLDPWTRERSSRPSLRNFLMRLESILATEPERVSDEDPPDWHPVTHGAPKSDSNYGRWNRWIREGCPPDADWQPGTPRHTGDTSETVGQ